MGASFDDLLKQMPAIAEAVNAFDEEATKQRALDALLDAFFGHEREDEERVHEQAPDDPDGAGVNETPAKKKAASKRKRGAAGPGGATRKRVAASTPSIDKSLDLQPGGRQSFADFAAEKQPKNHQERQTCAVYWLKEVAQVDAVTVDHIYTCYRLVKWKLPNQFKNNLWMNASRHGVLDTGDANNITLTSIGHNLVGDLPRDDKG